ncbi:hypothetical protein TWF694_004488 [Orbilia ellipsospora]|uniref:Uncharacterized protein n=1 Tax=Orbilia ellipsospora TaxID=2528407 RepID=A0AAV9WW90_9PEZI
MPVYKEKIPYRYVEKRQLDVLLSSWFGSDNFEWEVIDDEFLVITLYDASMKLNDHQLEAIRQRCFA